MAIKNENPNLFQARARHQNDSIDLKRELSGASLMRNLIRVGFLLLVAGVLLGAWTVGNAHLAEQFLGVPEQATGLIDPDAEAGALTPENIEMQVMRFNLRMQEEQLYQPVSDDVRPRHFAINIGEPARFIAAR